MKIRQFVLFQFLFIAVLLQSCSKTEKTQQVEEETPTRSIPAFTQKEGILTVLLDNSLTSYFIFQGEPMGFEYEMLNLFAKENNLKLEIKIIGQVDHILDSLSAGKGDLVAANLTISADRLQKVAFTEPLFRTSQILVQRLPENRKKLTKDQIEASLIRDRLDLEGRRVMVRKNSSYELLLHNLISETGIELDIAYSPGDVVTENLIDLVANNELDFTLCDQNKAMIFNAFYDNIDIATPMSLSQPIAWAVNKESTELLASLNSWLQKRKGSLEFNMIENRYFEMSRRKERLIARDYDVVREGKISVYDDLIKKYVHELNWDWQLLAALIYQESMFNPKIKSWRGAQGLMQLMPRTAQSYGVKPAELHKPERNVYAGIKHLAMLQELWKSQLPDSTEVIKFTLGSYNVGQGHVEDAIRLAKKNNADPSKWDGNVADMLLKKSIPKYYKDPVVKYGYCRGKEPVKYVETILNTYELYKSFTK